MFDTCPQCGSNNVTLEPASNYNIEANFLEKIFFKLLRETSRKGHKRRGQYILSCKACGKAGVVFID